MYRRSRVTINESINLLQLSVMHSLFPTRNVASWYKLYSNLRQYLDVYHLLLTAHIQRQFLKTSGTLANSVSKLYINKSVFLQYNKITMYIATCIILTFKASSYITITLSALKTKLLSPDQCF